MEIFSSTPGWYAGRPVTAGLTPSNPSAARFNSTTNASTTRTGLSSPMKSFRHSGSNVTCCRSWPSTNRDISAPVLDMSANSTGRASRL